MRFLPVLLTAAVLIFPARQSDAAPSVSHVRVVNLSDHNFATAWVTNSPTHASILFGTSCAGATMQGNSEEVSDGYVHLVSASGNLSANTPYFFKIVNNGSVDDHGGHCYAAHTVHQFASPGVPLTVYGFVKSGSSCIRAAAGVLVRLTVRHGSPALPLAAMTSSTGIWSLVVTTAIDTAGRPLPLQAGDTLSIKVDAGRGNVRTASAIYQLAGGPQHLPTTCLSRPPSPVATNPAIPITPIFTSTSLPGSVTTRGTATRSSTPSMSREKIAGKATNPTATAGTFVLPTTPPGTITLPGAVPTLPVNTPVPTRTPSATPRPASTPPSTRLKLKAFLSHASVVRGKKQDIVVQSDPGTLVTQVVTYADQTHAYAHRTIGRSGRWKHTWVIRARRAGTAQVRLTATLHGRSVSLILHFAVK